MKREFFGASIEEALERAGLALGADPAGLEYSLISGEFGRPLGPRKVAILVEVPEGGGGAAPSRPVQEEAPERETGSAQWASYVLKGIFSRMGIDVGIVAEARGENTVLTVDLKDESLDLRRGESRELRGAVQHLVNRTSSGEGEGGKRFIVDIGGTLEERHAQMSGLASRLAEKAILMEREIHVYLMDSQDRRIVHTVLSQSRRVETEASGGAQFRVLVIKPEKDQ